MDDHPAATAPLSFESVLGEAAERLAADLASDLDHALADPIVRLLMAADGVEVSHLMARLRQMAQRLRSRASRAADQPSGLEIGVSPL